MTIEDDLKELIIDNFKSIRQFSAHVDIPATTIQSMLNNGIENAGVKKVIKICDTLGIDAAAVTDGYIKEKIINHLNITVKESSHIKKYRSLQPQGKEMVDLILDREYEFLKQQLMQTEQKSEYEGLLPFKIIPSYRTIAGASAGFGQYVFDDLVPTMIKVDSDSKADFVIDVIGDSMQPTYQNGDGLLVKKQDSVDIGEIGIFMVDKEAFVKEYGSDRLISHNKKYPDILLNEYQDISCIGKVLEKLG